MLSSSKDAYVSTFFARQPIFTPENKIWGYELLYRHGPEAEAALFEDKDAATLVVLVNSISSPCADVLRDRKILIHFPPRCILQRAPYALPATNSVVQVSESSTFTPELLEQLRALKEDGRLIAVDDFESRPSSKELLALADIVIVDFLDAPEDRIRALLHRLHSFPGLTLAKRVENAKRLELARSMGFSLFQGFFFQKPELVSGRTLSTLEMTRLNLIKAIEAPEPDFEAIGLEITHDLSLSYRLLRLINSPAFGLAKKIDSIKQALLILGQKQLKQWLRLILLTDLSPANKTSELAYLSVLRALFLLELGQRSSASNSPSPDSLYLLGLFSLLDAILDLPAQEIIPSLPLDKALVAALVKERNHFSPWLDVAICFENGAFDQLDTLCSQLAIDPVAASHAYFNAVRWTREFFEIAENSNTKR